MRRQLGAGYLAVTVSGVRENSSDSTRVLLRSISPSIEKAFSPAL